MTKFHINRNGEAARCEATAKACPLGGEHYDSMKEAASATMEKELEGELEPIEPITDFDLAESVSAWAHSAQEQDGFSDSQRRELEGLLWDSYREAEQRGDREFLEDESGDMWYRVQDDYMKGIKVGALYSWDGVEVPTDRDELLSKFHESNQFRDHDGVELETAEDVEDAAGRWYWRQYNRPEGGYMGTRIFEKLSPDYDDFEADEFASYARDKWEEQQ